VAITTAMIKELREATGAGILDSKKALEAASGNFDKAVEFLREKGLAQAAKKASREANDGTIAAQINDDGTRAAMIEVNCETDFVARTDDFSNFVANITQQVFENEQIASVEDLLTTKYVADTGKTVAEAVQETISKLGENIVVRRLMQYKLTGEGIIDNYIHSNRRVGVLVELHTDTPVSDREALRELAHDLTLQIAAANPRFLSINDVPADVVEEERKIYMAQVVDDKKSDEIKARIVEGRLKKFYQEICLLEQNFVKDDTLSVGKLVQQAGKRLGTPINISRFTRFEIGGS
jgi:elongation factor Ts